MSVITKHRGQSDTSSASRQKHKSSLFQPDPLSLVILVSLVDAADVVLLSASYVAFERDFFWTPQQLGTLSAGQGVAFALCMPIWGVFLPLYGCRNLLLVACGIWTLLTFLTPAVAWFPFALMIRFFSGAALSGAVPITQAVVANAV